MIQQNNIFIPVTRRVKGYTRFVGKYVTGRRKRFRPHKVYIFLICPSVRLSVCLSVRMNAEISETMGARLLRFGVQIPELLTQCKFVSAQCHAHSNAHKPPKTVAPTVLMLDKKFQLKCIGLVNTYRLIKKNLHRPL